MDVIGVEEAMRKAQPCFASLFTDRAISYRALHGFDHLHVALSVGGQPMVRSDEAGANQELRSFAQEDQPNTHLARTTSTEH
jgi:phosphoenolpyruvate synthase/pyruvate phosphate dikinase